MTFLRFYELLCENDAARSYSCLMLDCSQLYTDISKLQDDIDVEDIYDDEPGHGVEKSFHISVKYGIHSSNVSEVFSKLSFKPIKYKLKNLSLFENDKFDVVKFDIESKDLHSLNKQVCDNLECTDKFPVYHPHMTVFYAKKGTGKKYIKKTCELLGKEFTSNRFIFSDKNSNKVWKDV